MGSGYSQARVTTSRGQPIGREGHEGHIHMDATCLTTRSPPRSRRSRKHRARRRPLPCRKRADDRDRQAVVPTSRTTRRVRTEGGGKGALSGVRRRPDHRRRLRGWSSGRRPAFTPEGSSRDQLIDIIPSLTITVLPPTRTAVSSPAVTSASTSSMLGRPISKPCSTIQRSVPSRRSSRAAR